MEDLNKGVGKITPLPECLQGFYPNSATNASAAIDLSCVMREVKVISC